MFDQEMQLRIGSVATDFFLNLTAVAALVALPLVLPAASVLARPGPVEDPRLYESVHAELMAAEQAAAELETARAAAKDASAKSDAKLAAEAVELRADLAQREAANSELAKRLEQVRSAPRAGSLGMPVSHTTDKRPIFFILAKGLILPVSKDAGQFTDMPVNGGVRVFIPFVAGDPIGSISEGKTLSAKAVAAINPNRDFAFVFLSDDSFGAFYQLRGLLQQRGIAQGWAPLTAPNRQVVFATGGQGRRPDVQE